MPNTPVRVRDQQGKVHVFPPGTTPAQIQAAMDSFRSVEDIERQALSTGGRSVLDRAPTAAPTIPDPPTLDWVPGWLSGPVGEGIRPAVETFADNAAKFGRAARNIPKSAGRLAGDTLTGVAALGSRAHPLGEAADMLLGQETLARQAGPALLNSLGERYGSLEAAERTLEEDPRLVRSLISLVELGWLEGG